MTNTAPPFSARAATLVVKPSGIAHFQDILLQWRPSEGRVTPAKSQTRVFVPDQFFGRVKGAGEAAAGYIRFDGARGDRSITALPKGHRVAEEPNHFVVRVCVRAKKCRLHRVLVRKGSGCKVRRLDNEELFAIPVGATVAFAFTDGRTQVARLTGDGIVLVNDSTANRTEWLEAATPDRGAPRRHSSQPGRSSRRGQPVLRHHGSRHHRRGQQVRAN